MRVVEVKHPDFSRAENKYLYRYMDLFKLLDLLKYQRLYFRRIDTYEDMNEGIPALFFEAISKAGKSKSIVNDSPWKDIYPSHASVESHYKKTYQERVFSSCWFSKESESYLMWKNYSHGQFGVAVKFDAEVFIENVVNNASKNKGPGDNLSWLFFCSPISYMKLLPFERDEQKLKSGKYHFFLKDECYSSENEFRFCIAKGEGNEFNENSISLPIESIEKGLIEVIGSPFLSDFDRKWVEDILKQYKLDIRFRMSDIRLRGK